MQGEKVGVATRLPSTPTVNIEREHQKGLALANPIIQELGQLQITNEEEYLAADALLGRVRQSRKVWGSIWEQIQGRVIKPQREALEGVYFINREVDGPLEKGEKLLKSEMQLYKNEERRRLEQENRQRDAEAARTQQLIEEARTKLETARGSVKAILTRTVNRLETQQQVVMETTPLPVIGANSSTRQVKTIEVDNLQAFAVALTIGKLKDHPIRAAVTAAVNAVLKGEARTQEQKDIMAQWPGLKLVESTQIVGH
jgi:hypothetical protein